MKEPLNQGALIDTRTDDEKLSDIEFREVVATANPVEWIEKPRSEWRKFPIFNQDGSGSCVAQTIAKMAGIMYYILNGVYVHFSALHVYIRRSNKPQSGMGYPDCFNIAGEGITLEALVPSQDMSDDEMDSTKIEKYKDDVGKIFKLGTPITLPTGDIETVASVIQTTDKAVMGWFFFETKEWLNIPVIINKLLEMAGLKTNRHSITLHTHTLLGKTNMPDNPEVWGKKAIIADDSWGINYGFQGVRVLTEDFFVARNFLAAYVKNFKFEVADQTLPKPVYNFTKKLEIGMTDIDVLHLQERLRYEGFFPMDQTLTMYYGALTASGVLKYQLKYHLDTVENLNLWKGRYFGTRTIAEMNK